MSQNAENSLRARLPHLRDLRSDRDADLRRRAHPPPDRRKRASAHSRAVLWQRAHPDPTGGAMATSSWGSINPPSCSPTRDARSPSCPRASPAQIALSRADVTTAPWPGGFDLVVLGANCLYELASDRGAGGLRGLGSRLAGAGRAPVHGQQPHGGRAGRELARTRPPSSAASPREAAKTAPGWREPRS